MQQPNDMSTEAVVKKISSEETLITPDLFTENILSANVGCSLPSKEGEKVVVKVYGLIGYTRYIDLQFNSEHVVPENVFVFENKHYKIASVIETENGQHAINAVSVEYSS